MYSSEELKYLKEKEFEKREKRLEKSIPQKLKYQKELKKDKLHITYVMTWTGVCGGTKIILEHANRLTERGHKITLISHDVKPTWFPINTNIQFIQVPWTEVLCKSIPKCDLIVATYWREIYECIEQKIAPVIYFEQGDFHLFDMQALDERTYKYIKKQLENVQFVYTVSSFAKEKMKSIYNKESKVIPNAVDKKIFYHNNNKRKHKNTYITIIGAQQSEFKHINDILEAIKILRKEGYKINLNWITPVKPEKTRLKAIINPPQIEIANSLRKSDIYVCASMYESFCLPVLEAMTCGAAVITTNNGGNADFVKDHENALIIQKENINDICEKIKILINNTKLRNKIAKNGIETSKRYSWDKVIDEIEEYYKEVSKYKVCKE